jgi:hypothetical integral membrane protein (TIGR02206 family)
VSQDFHLFGPAHVAILAAIAAAAVVSARVARRRPAAVRIALGALLAANELVWWVWRIGHEGLHRNALPLQFSDLTIWVTVAALLTLSRWTVEVAYYAGLASAAMAVLTPDLWAPFPSYPTVYFFLEHGGLIIAVAALVGGGMARPGGFWRAWVVLNVFAAAVGAFNAVLGTNYMYLCRKPAGASLLDWFGPWPWYLLPAEIAAVALFWLLRAPWRVSTSSGTPVPARPR